MMVLSEQKGNFEYPSENYIKEGEVAVLSVQSIDRNTLTVSLSIKNG